MGVFCAPFGACRIEPVTADTDQEPAELQGEAPPVPVRDTTEEAPLTPFRSLLQGAWGVEQQGQHWGPEEPAPQALPGLLIMAVSPHAASAEQAVQALCVALRAGADPADAIAAVVPKLECDLPVDPTSLREAVVATSAGDWGAAVTVPADESAFRLADRARSSGMGFVVARPSVDVAEPQLPVALPASPRPLDCVAQPPLAIADVHGPSSPVPRPELQDGGVEAGNDEDGGIPDAALPSDDMGEEPAELRSKVVFVAVRNAEGRFAAAASAATVDAARYGTAGVVALPSRRLMVGPDGVVFVDPALQRQVVPDPAAALRAYDKLQRGEPVDDDVVYLRGPGAHVDAVTGLRFLHLDTSVPSAVCPSEGTL